MGKYEYVLFLALSLSLLLGGVPTFLTQGIAISLMTSLVLAGPVKRSVTETSFTDPCFTLSVEGPADTKPLSESIADLKERTAGIIEEAKLLKDYLKTQYGLDDASTQYMESYYNWISEEQFIQSDEQKQEAIREPIKALKAHYLLIAENVLYITNTRKVGPIYEKKREETTREKLLNFEARLYSCMCSIKIAVLARNETVYTVTDVVLNDIFLANSSPLQNAIFRTYITIQESLELFQFMNTVYAEIQRTLNDTGA